MADYYFSSTGSNANNGTTWALAKLTTEGALAIMAAGDRAFCQGTGDISAAARTLTSPGVGGNPCYIIGCKTGTTNEGAAIIASDLISILTDTVFPITTTNGGTDINLVGSIVFKGIDLVSADRINVQTARSEYHFHGCKVTGSDFRMFATTMSVHIQGCQFNIRLWPSTSSGGSSFHMFGGSAAVINGSLIRDANMYANRIRYDSVDMSASTFTHILDGGTVGAGNPVLNNITLPNSFVDFANIIPTGSPSWEMEMIGCTTDTAAKPDNESYQQHSIITSEGRFESDPVAVRTGGATDNASGLFSYKITPNPNLTGLGGHSVKSPWCMVWVQAGSQNVTIFIANDGGVNYTQSQAWLEYGFPNSNDRAAYDAKVLP